MTWEENNNNKLFQWKQEGVKMGQNKCNKQKTSIKIVYLKPDRSVILQLKIKDKTG